MFKKSDYKELTGAKIVKSGYDSLLWYVCKVLALIQYDKIGKVLRTACSCNNPQVSFWLMPNHCILTHSRKNVAKSPPWRLEEPVLVKESQFMMKL